MDEIQLQLPPNRVLWMINQLILYEELFSPDYLVPTRVNTCGTAAVIM